MDKLRCKRHMKDKRDFPALATGHGTERVFKRDKVNNTTDQPQQTESRSPRYRRIWSSKPEREQCTSLTYSWLHIFSYSTTPVFLRIEEGGGRRIENRCSDAALWSEALIYYQEVSGFLVKWRGYPSEQNTWEPRKNLINCDTKLEKF